MRWHWLGWISIASFGALASADPAPAKPDTKTAKVDGPPKPEAKPKARDKEADEILALTADPQLGKADRIGGDEIKGMVAFTFDDGPNPATTPAVIDALEKYNIPATFFIISQRLVGKNGEKSRELVAREVAGGFFAECHSFSHPNLKGANAKTFQKEIDQALRILGKESGKPIGMFRPPYGAIDGNGQAWLRKRGLTEVQWSIDGFDWRAKDGEKLRKKTMALILKHQGGVVLMHDRVPLTAKILPDILDDLEAENCRLLAEKKDLIVPVSLHYFVQDKGKARPIPEAVKHRTEAYRNALPGRCSKRPAPDPKTKPDNKAASNTKPAAASNKP